MDILPIALVFLIMLLSIFLSVLGIQVFLILKDLRRDLNKVNKLINLLNNQGLREEMEEDLSLREASSERLSVGKKVIASSEPQQSSRRFYKKVLK